MLGTEVLPGGYVSYTTVAVGLTLAPQGFALVSADFADEAGATGADGTCAAGAAAPSAPTGSIRPTGRVEETADGVNVRTDWGRVVVDRGTGEYLATDLDGEPLLVPGGANGLLTASVDGRHHRSTPERVTVLADGPLFATIRTEGRIGPLPFATEATVYLDRPRIDFRSTVEVRGQSIGTTEVAAEWEGKDEPVVQDGKLMVHFTPSLSGRACVMQDFPFSVGETRRRDINAGYWVDVSDGRRGVTLANRGTMGYRWDGRSLSNILLYSGKYSWGDAHAFLDGVYSLEYSISFHEGDWRTGQAHRIGLEYNFPSVAVADTPRQGYMRPADACLAVLDAGTDEPCPNLVVSALFTRDGQPYLRLYEFMGVESTTIRVTLGGLPVALAPVDHLHQEVGGDRRDTAEVPAYGIRTFRLVVARPRLDVQVGAEGR